MEVCRRRQLYWDSVHVCSRKWCWVLAAVVFLVAVQGVVSCTQKHLKNFPFKKPVEDLCFMFLCFTLEKWSFPLKVSEIGCCYFLLWPVRRVLQRWHLRWEQKGTSCGWKAAGVVPGVGWWEDVAIWLVFPTSVILYINSEPVEKLPLFRIIWK